MKKQDPFVGTDTGYLSLRLAGAPHLLTHKRYSDLIKRELNRSIRKRELVVGAYGIMPGRLLLLVQRRELPLKLWRGAFVGNLSCAIYARLEREEQSGRRGWLKYGVDKAGVLSPQLLWAKQEYKPVTSVEQYEALEMYMYELPVREGLAKGIDCYPNNSLHNGAGIEQLGIDW